MKDNIYDVFDSISDGFYKLKIIDDDDKIIHEEETIKYNIKALIEEIDQIIKEKNMLKKIEFIEVKDKTLIFRIRKNLTFKEINKIYKQQWTKKRA